METTFYLRDTISYSTHTSYELVELWFTVRPKQNGSYFANFCILIQIALKFVSIGTINKQKVLDQITARHKRTTSHYLTQ